MRTSDGASRKQEMHRSLTNQPPQSDAVVQRFEDLRVPAKALSDAICDLVPDCREKSLALTKLEESVMWAIKGIALNQEG